MYRHVLAWTLVVCTLLVGRAAPAAEPLPPRAEWIPQDAVIVVDIAQPRQLLDHLLDDRVTGAVTAAPQYQAATANAEFKQLVGLVKYYQEKYQVDFRGLCGKLLGGGVTWAVGPNEASLLIVDTEDAKLLEEVHEFIRVVARGEAEKRGRAEPDRVGRLSRRDGLEVRSQRGPRDRRQPPGVDQQARLAEGGRRPASRRQRRQCGQVAELTAPRSKRSAPRRWPASTPIWPC